MTFDEGLPNLRPVSFFSLSFDCRQLQSKAKEFSIKEKRFAVPDASLLTQETPFAKIYMAWSTEGLYFVVDAEVAEIKTFFPEITRGDSVEFFIDTRDVKTSGFNTKFCHQFFFLPEAASGRNRGEITRFRTEDSHELCNPLDLEAHADASKKGYELKIFIPAQCLYGYDPNEVNRLGFTYRINRLNLPSQHFSVISEEFPIEQQPSLWSSVKLVK